MKRLGDILIESGFLTAAELAEALSVQKESGKRLGEVITEMGLMSEFDILRAVSSQYNYPIIDLTSIEVDPKAMALLDEKYCTENRQFIVDFLTKTEMNRLIKILEYRYAQSSLSKIKY